ARFQLTKQKRRDKRRLLLDACAGGLIRTFWRSETLTHRYLFTSESVTEGHPDKICDQISDAILDAMLTKDPKARVAAECSATTGLILVAGEITTTANVDIAEIVRGKIREIGYEGERGGGFDGNTCAVLLSIDKQSPDIASGVTKALEQ